MAKAMHRHISSKKPTKRTRSDYRTFEPGTFEYYLVHRLIHREDYHPTGPQTTKINNTKRDRKGNYLAIDRTGHLELDERFVNGLNVILYEEVRGALNTVTEMENGQEMMQALDWYQRAELYKAQGHTAEDRASSLGISPSTLRRRMYECARLAYAVIIRAASGIEPVTKT